MSILFLAVPLSLILGGFFVAGFFWAVDKGQFEDLETPAHRILFEESNTSKNQEQL